MIKRFTLLVLFLLSTLTFAVDVPSVKTVVTMTGQTSTSVTNVTIFTPKVTGLYRLSIFTETSGSYSSAPNAVYNYTSNSGLVTTNGSTCTLIEDTHTSQCSQIIRSLANDPIDLTVVVSFGSGTTYDLYVVVEHLD